MTLDIDLVNSTHSFIEVVKTLEMGKFNNFEPTTKIREKFEICGEENNNTEKIYLIFNSLENETFLIKFEIFDESEHEPIIFYMKKISEIAPVPELNVLMTLNETKSLDHDYDYSIIEKSKLVQKKLIIDQDKAYFYISSEVGEQILISHRIVYNSTGVKHTFAGAGTYGFIYYYN